MAVLFGTGRCFVLGAALASVLLAGPALALAPEHETRRLMLATEEAVVAENWGEAAEYLNRLQQLEGEKPEDYYFYRGRVMLQSSHLNEAQSALETYVSQAGAEGAHYQESLQLITSIEKTRRQNAVAPQAAGESEPVAVIEPAGEGRERTKKANRKTNERPRQHSKEAENTYRPTTIKTYLHPRRREQENHGTKE